MSVEALHLRKLLQLLFAVPTDRRAMLRAEVRQDIAKAVGEPATGGDFYGPFWSDVKEHVSGRADIRSLTEYRIDKNPRRSRLYPGLTKGFLNWWEEQRRWTNGPFEIIKTPSSNFTFDNSLTIKIDNFLAVKDANGFERYVYPYFSERPALRNESARIGLWIISMAFKGLDFERFKVLDVPRGRIYSPDRCYLEGDEESNLRRRYRELWNEYVEVEELF